MKGARMATRKDDKGRNLHCGEGQRPDGRYYFKYTDAKGRTKYLYSWTLTIHDPQPLDHKFGPCLRELEKKVQKELFMGIAVENMTVRELAEKYVATKTAVRATTRTGYKTVLNFLGTDEFGSRRIDSVTTLDAKQWLIYLQNVVHKGYSSIHTLRGVLRPAFQLAEEDDLIRRNPFNFELATLLYNDMIPREALTNKQERAFLDFVEHDKHFSRYYDAMYVLFNTGLRISEFCGLTKADINFKQMSIKVERQLMRSSDMRYYIEQPKTKNGVRYVPMSPQVAACLQNMLRDRKRPKVEMLVDGVSGFLALDKFGRPCVALHWENYFRHALDALDKYNRTYKQEIPKVTPHVCRHTFCSKMARSGMSPAKLKYIMGHSDIDTTFNVYTHLGFEDVREDMLRCLSDKTAA